MSVWSRWTAWLGRTEAPDAQALVRILCGVAALGIVLDVTLRGLVQVAWVDAAHGGYRPLGPFHWLTQILGPPTPGVAWTLVTLSVASSVALVAGFGGRITAFVVLQSFLALTSLNPDTGGLEQNILVNALWLVVLSRSTATASIDCRLRTGSWTSTSPIAAWPRHLMVLQLALLYFVSALHKVSIHWTPFGGWSALYYILQQPTWQALDGDLVARLFPLTQSATALVWAWELTWPLVPLSMIARASADVGGRWRSVLGRFDLRKSFVLVGVGIHAGIALSMHVGPFFTALAPLYAALAHPREVRGALGAGARALRRRSWAATGSAAARQGHRPSRPARAAALGAGLVTAFLALPPLLPADDAPPPRTSDRPHVVLVMGCTVRRDQLTPYGGHPSTTPYLERLASEGARFADALAAAPWTRPAAAALLTGRHALSIGMVERTDKLNDRALAPEVTTLAERLQRAGYVTLGATANPNINAAFGFAQGFDQYDGPAELWRHGGRRVTGDVLVDRILGRVREAPRDRPLYLQVMLADAHWPHPVSKAETERFAAAGVPPRLQSYRASLRRLDDAVSRLASGLAVLGVSPADTLFVFVADHGEGLSLPPHHGVGHGNFTYRSTVSIPWIVRGPGIRRGHTVGGLASGVDLVPTLVDLLGIDGSVGAGRSWVGPGRSWAGPLRGAADRTERDRARVDTWFESSNRAAVVTDAIECHRDYAPRDAHGTRAARLRPPSACYDRRRDPMATRPLPDWQGLLEELDRWRFERLFEAERWDREAEHWDREAEHGDRPTRAPMDRRSTEALRALGYVQ